MFNSSEAQILISPVFLSVEARGWCDYSSKNVMRDIKSTKLWKQRESDHVIVATDWVVYSSAFRNIAGASVLWFYFESMSLPNLVAPYVVPESAGGDNEDYCDMASGSGTTIETWTSSLAGK